MLENFFDGSQVVLCNSSSGVDKKSTVKCFTFLFLEAVPDVRGYLKKLDGYTSGMPQEVEDSRDTPTFRRL